MLSGAGSDEGRAAGVVRVTVGIGTGRGGIGDRAESSGSNGGTAVMCVTTRIGPFHDRQKPSLLCSSQKSSTTSDSHRNGMGVGGRKGQIMGTGGGASRAMENECGAGGAGGSRAAVSEAPGRTAGIHVVAFHSESSSKAALAGWVGALGSGLEMAGEGRSQGRSTVGSSSWGRAMAGTHDKPCEVGGNHSDNETVAIPMTIGIGIDPSFGKRSIVSSASINGSSGAGSMGSSRLWAGSTRGLTVGATGGINGAGGRGWNGASVATAASGVQGNGDGECNGDRAQSSGVVVGSWEASADGSRCRASDSN